MTRYIDADKLAKNGWHLERCGASNVLLQSMSIADVPSADVVSKSEYDEVLSNWQKIHDSYTADCIEHYNKGQQDAARKIFEEIEKIINDDRINRKLTERGFYMAKHGEPTFEQRIAELKKKYTEEEEDENNG